MIEHGKEAFRLFINNEYYDGYFLLDKWAKQSFYHSLGKALVLGLRFGFTLNTEHYKDAWEATMQTVRKLNRYRHKQSTAEKASSLIFKRDYSDWTDLECHAELAFAEICAAYAALIVVNDRSITGLVKAAFKIKTCHSCYKECKSILKNRKEWQDPEMKQHFESGVLLGLGLFDMAISVFPSRLIRLLEIAGFSGNRIVGMDQLMACERLTEGIRYPVVSIVLSGYYGFGEFFYGLGEPDVDCIIRIHEYWQPRAPQSIAVLMGSAFRATWAGDFEEACQLYDEYSKKQSIVKAFHYIAHWQKMWIYSCLWEWDKVCENSHILVKECPWSPSMFAYIHACFLSMQAEQQDSPDLWTKVNTYFRRAIKLKRTFGGKRAFHEKLVCDKAKIFVENPSRVVLAPLDLMYLWNTFKIAARNPDCLPNILAKIEEKLQDHTREADVETYAYLTFMKGICYSHSNLPLMAADCFFQLLGYEKELKIETHLIPQACFEVAEIYRRMGDAGEAKKWYKKAKSYDNYMTDSLIKFRVEAALYSIKSKQLQGSRES